MKKRNCPFSYTAIEMIDENDNLLKNKRNIKETCDYKYLLHKTIIATSSVIIDRTILGDFRMPLRRGGQDYATWLMSVSYTHLQLLFRRLCLIVVDIISIILSFFLSAFIAYDGSMELSFLKYTYFFIPILLIGSLFFFIIMKLYDSLWSYASINE